MKTLTLGVAALAITLSLFAGQMAAAQDPPPQISAAQRAFEAGQYDQSLQAIAEARERNEAGVQEAFLAAHVHLRRKQNDQAKAELTRLAESDDETWRLVGESSTLLIDNNLDRSLELATEATNRINARNASAPADASPDTATQLRDFPAFYQLGLIKTRREDWTGAAEAFERAAQLNPSFAYTYYYAGSAYSRLKQADRVASHFERFLKLAPNAPERAAVQSIMRTLRGS